MTVESEFKTVDLVRDSKAETRGVDSFALALLKAERQIRRLVTFLVFQSEHFGPGDEGALRETLGNRRRLYLHHFMAAWDELYDKTLTDLLGREHDNLRKRLSDATDIRNKLFHGQLTDRYLSTEDLLSFVDDIRAWCSKLGEAASREVGYDGFDRTNPMGSFRKSDNQYVPSRLKKSFQNVKGYEEYLKKLERRPNKSFNPTSASALRAARAG